MGLGSSFLGGYSQGLQTSTSPLAQYMDTIAQRRQLQAANSSGGGSSSTGLKTASDIENEAKMAALAIKTQELENLKAEVDIRETQLNNEAARGLQTAQTRNVEQTRLNNMQTMSQDRHNAYLTEQAGLATTEAANKKNQKDADFESALRGAYTYDSDAVKSYFDKYGNSDISIGGIEQGENGEVILNLGNKSTKFKSPQEFVEKFLLPAQVANKAIDNKMSEKDTAEIGIKKQLADAATTKAGAAETTAELKLNQLTAADQSLLKMYSAAYENALDDETRVDIEAKVSDLLSKYPDVTTTGGLQTGGGTATGAGNAWNETGGNLEQLKAMAGDALSRAKTEAQKKAIKDEYKRMTGEDYDSSTEEDDNGEETTNTSGISE